MCGPRIVLTLKCIQYFANVLARNGSSGTQSFLHKNTTLLTKKIIGNNRFYVADMKINMKLFIFAQTEHKQFFVFLADGAGFLKKHGIPVANMEVGI